MKVLIVCFSVPILFLSHFAQARVFSFENESVASYLNFRVGMGSVGNSPYQWQSASSYGGDSFELGYGGDFGVYFRTSSFGLALGILVHTFDPVTGGTGSNSSGSLYTVESEGLAYGPQILFDYQFGYTKSYMWKLVFGGGYQFAKFESTYTVSSAGQSLVGGQTSFSESLKGSFPFAVLGVGTEFMMSGSMTMNVLFGYHYTFSGSWQYGEGGQNFAGSHSQGANVLFEDGTEKSIDWSYPFLQVGFQFYIDKVR